MKNLLQHQPRFVGWGLVFLTFILTILNNDYQLFAPLYSNDFNAWHMPSVAVLRGLGAAFSSYWDIEPPALFFMTSLWALVSPSLAWFHVLNILLQSSICWEFWRVLKKAFTWYESVIIYGVTVVIFFSPHLQSMFLPSEINGTFFVFIGLRILLSERKLAWRAFGAALAFGLAGQMKEVFAFTLLALAPLYIQESLKNWQALTKVIAVSVAGLIVALTISFSYLFFTHSIAAYQEVHHIKLQAFKLTDFELISRNAYAAAQFPIFRFIHLNYPLIVVAIGIASLGWLGLTLDKKVRATKAQKGGFFLRINLPEKLYPYSVLLFYWIGSWLGYMAQNRYSNKYDIAVVFSTFIFLGLLGLVLKYAIISVLRQVPSLPKKLTGETAQAILLILIFVFFMTPQKVFILSPYYQLKNFHPRAYVHKWLDLEHPKYLGPELKIKNGTTKNDCIQGVFGWGIGNLYHYTERRSCTRFFIPNIVHPDHVAEYRRSMIENPPAAIYYSPVNADLDTVKFEEIIFNYSHVIGKCYRQDEEHSIVYWPTAATLEREALQGCIRSALIEVGQWGVVQ